MFRTPPAHLRSAFWWLEWRVRGDENLRHAHTQALKEVENKKATGEDRHHLPGEG